VIPPRRALFLFWGRRGPMARLALEIANLTPLDVGADVTVSVSTSNEQIRAFAAAPDQNKIFRVATFVHSPGFLAGAWRVPALAAQISDHIRTNGTELVVNMMPHVWTPFIIGAVQAAGAQYVTIVHDAEVHPGDYRTRIAKPILDMELRRADRVLALSRHVAARVTSLGLVGPTRIGVVFHPDITSAPAASPIGLPQGLTANAPLRLLFLGRIMHYKGLDLFIEAMVLLRQRGRTIAVAVCGEGDLGDNAAVLARLGANVDNRWVSDADLVEVIGRTDCLVLSHREASQSGLIALAHGSGLPVVVTPVGGLVEQIIVDQTGIVAVAVTAVALADAIERLYTEPGLHAAITDGIARTRSDRSVSAFVRACLLEGGFH
jgi:glycosyltransferase involved in cell wall biosynthesis